MRNERAVIVCLGDALSTSSYTDAHANSHSRLFVLTHRFLHFIERQRALRVRDFRLSRGKG
jgi:hypothetical protein